MKISSFILLFISILYSCGLDNSTTESTEFESLKSKEPEITKNEIYACMRSQELAWNDADIEGFMECYWKSDSLRFIGKSGLNLGWQKTLDNYKKSYPDSAAMGKLSFENLEFLHLNPKQAFVIGKWTLYRSFDTLSGHYSLIWEKKAEGWKIITDHSS